MRLARLSLVNKILIYTILNSQYKHQTEATLIRNLILSFTPGDKLISEGNI